jgi:hypothetical protein
MRYKDLFLGITVLISILGLFAIAIVDEGSRSGFTELAKFVVGAYVGYLIPSPRQ